MRYTGLAALAVKLALGGWTMQAAEAQEKKDEKKKVNGLYDELVTVKSFKDGTESYSKDGVNATRQNSKTGGVKFYIRGKDVLGGGMKATDTITAEDGAVWTVGKVTKAGGGSPHYICEVTLTGKADPPKKPKE